VSQAAATTEFFALVGGADVDWISLGMTVPEFLDACATHDVQAMMHARIIAHDRSDQWPDTVRDELARVARAETACEMVRGEQVASALDALAHAGVRPLVLKGTALAYTVYDAPVTRPRLDTDLLIEQSHADAARTALADRGYVAPPYCDELFAQFQMEKTDTFGLQHVIDIHWNISTQPVFADVLTFEELRSRAIPVPALGQSAVAPGFVDALLLACIHPVMHHQNVERILWTYDTHLLASRLTRDDFKEFVWRARQKRVATVCAHALRRAQARFGTLVPADVLRALSDARDEPSAEYLASHRRWHHELASSVRGLPTFGARVKLLRDVLLPAPSYMLGAYKLRGKPLAQLLLPALYAHRNARGAWKILTGKK
jgi:hypothetical protein